jgi:O-antigen/teichoic acid export membrane protein
LKKLFQYLGNSERSIVIYNNILKSLIYKGGVILASFLLVPLTIQYINVSNYGIWLTVTSFTSWFTLFDIGIGHGLRNKFAEAKADKNYVLIETYVSTAYIIISLFCLILLLVFNIINFYIDWSIIFNVNNELKADLQLLMLFVLNFFIFQLIAKLIVSIYLADQKSSYEGLISFITQALSLIIIVILNEFAPKSFLLFGITLSIIPIIVLLIFNIYSFKTSYKSFIPSIKRFSKKHVKGLFILGSNFFIIQIAGVLLFSTDNIIVTQLFGPNFVTPYNISFKYFGISILIMNMISYPYWSGITDAFKSKDLMWIKKSMKLMIILSISLIFLVILMFFLSGIIYPLWIGNEIKIPFTLNLIMALYFVISLIIFPFTIFINGIGKVKIQLIQGSIVALLNIPLSIFFAKNLNFGVSGVMFSTFLCMIPSAVLAPIQYYKIINNNAKGIWNK